MEPKKSLYKATDYDLDTDGLVSWEEFYGSNEEDFVGSILEMYDLLIGRSSGIKEDLINSSQRAEDGFLEKCQSSFKEVKTKDENGNGNGNGTLDVKKKNVDNWCEIIKRSWSCRCSEKSVLEAITRCSSCNTKDFKIRSTDIRDGQTLKSGVLTDINSTCQSEPSLPQMHDPNPSKCELVTCPAGFSTPTTPVQQRLTRVESRSSFRIKKSENGFRYVTRPSSVSSLASSSSSSSGTSSCFGARRLGVPHKSSAYLASIESLEDDSDVESQIQKEELCRSSKESEGSEDSGVHSPCTSLRPKYCDPHLSYMDKVVMEIIETEEVYVGDLRKIIEGYLLKWRSLPEFPLSDRLDCLFGNIEGIFRFNSLFLTELKECGLHPVKIARCFVKNNSGFSVYTEYCTNYPRTVSLLTELMRQEGTVRLFRERQTALQHTLPLGSYLLKPVQRILKYHLLLQNIVKQYSSGFDGYEDIVDALRTMTEIAQHINDMKRRHEHEVRVQEIQSLLLGWEGEDLTTYGELCAEGAFRMYGAKAVRHVFLFDKMVLITKKKEGSILGYKAHINCSNLMLIESVPGEPLSFHIIPFDNPKKQYTLLCRNLEQKREWTLQLKRVILENYNAVIPSHARQLVMELGQNKSDENYTNKILSKRQHLAPEYLEKRKQDKQKTESGLKSRLRRSKKFETGEKLKDQFEKVRSYSRNETSISFDETPTKEQTEKHVLSEVLRRKSEPNMHSYKKEMEKRETLLISEENSDENRESSEPMDKFEMKTLEHIVAQILKQNREFDKILKRQKQNIIERGREFGSRRRKRKGISNEENKNDQENVNNSNNQPDVSENPTMCNSYSDYSTLLGNNKSCEYGACESLGESKDFEKNQENVIKLQSTVKGTEDSSKNTLVDDGIPTSPSVWLRQQVHHLPTPTKKAGSLPRSFQIGSESSPNDPRSFRNFRISTERPFTIASDKLSSTILLDRMERFCKGHFFNSNSYTTEEENLTEVLSTPAASSDHINIHPEYKIYKSNLSTNILKNVLSSVQTKLYQIKADLDSPKLDSEKVNRERKASRVMCMLAKHYQKTLGNKHKSKNSANYLDLDESQDTSEPVLPVHKQGSSSIGARLANFTETECRINRVRPSKKAAAILGVYTDSVLSLASTSNATENLRKDEINDLNSNLNSQNPNTREDNSGEREDGDESTDSFYEKSFEAMDEELLNLCEDTQDQEINNGEIIGEDTCTTPPPVPAKPKKELILRKMIEIADNPQVAFYFEKEKGNTNSQQDAATLTTEVGGNKEPDTVEILSKGWVRHVVGKIQGNL